MVEFYAPWCGHCKSLAPEWKNAAKALKGIVGVVAVDATQATGSASKYEVKGFPTIKFFGDNKGKPLEYQGGRDAKAITDYALGQVSTTVKARAGGKGPKDAGAGSKPAGGEKAKAKKASGGGGKGDVVTLGSDNFEDLVFGSGTPWMVEFYAPWCGHCKNLAPEWKSAAEQMEGAVQFGAVDATVHGDLASRFGVKGYPTIVTFSAGSKGDKDAKPYNQAREAPALVAAAQALAAEAGSAAPAPGVAQLLSQAQWDETCTEGKKLCVLAVLPHILDDGAEKRAARIATLKEAAAKQRGKPLRFFWSQVGAQGPLESALNVGLVPAVFAISGEKKVYIVHKAAFTLEALSTFATSLTTNAGSRGSLPLPASVDLSKAIQAAKEWDGKDEVQEAGSEMSLDELDL
jgi:protein disulfide-isomerase A6